MKNHIKTVTVLVVVTSFFSAYSMEESNHFVVNTSTLGRTNPLLRMHGVCTAAENGFPDQLIPDNHQLYKDRGLALILSVLRLLGESDEVKSEETLKTICAAVCEGTPVTSKYVVKSKDGLCSVSIFPSQITSIFTSVENLFKYPPWLAYPTAIKVDRNRLWINAVFQGERKRIEFLDCIRGELKDKISEAPILTSIVLSYLPEYNVSAGRTVLIEEAKQKFDEKEQS